MAQLTIHGFLVSFPVYALLENARPATDTNHAQIDGIAWTDSDNGKAVLLFTDADLAQRYLIAYRNTKNVALGKSANSRMLSTMLQSVKALGFDWVVFDAIPEAGQMARAFPVDGLIEAANKVAKEEGPTD